MANDWSRRTTLAGFCGVLITGAPARAQPQSLAVLNYRVQKVLQTLAAIRSLRQRLEVVFPSHAHSYTLSRRIIFQGPILGRPAKVFISAHNDLPNFWKVVGGLPLLTDPAEPGYRGSVTEVGAPADIAAPSALQLAVLMIGAIETANREGRALDTVCSLYQGHSHGCSRDVSTSVPVTDGNGRTLTVPTDTGASTRTQTSAPQNVAIATDLFRIPMRYRVGDIVDASTLSAPNAPGVMDWIEAQTAGLQSAAMQFSTSFSQHRHTITTDAYTEQTAPLEGWPSDLLMMLVNAHETNILTSAPNETPDAPPPAPRVSR